MGLVLSQLSNQQNQDMRSTRSKAKNEDGHAASNTLAEQRVRGRIPATRNNTLPVQTTENKGNNLVIAISIKRLFIHDNTSVFGGI